MSSPVTSPSAPSRQNGNAAATTPQRRKQIKNKYFAINVNIYCALYSGGKSHRS